MEQKPSITFEDVQNDIAMHAAMTGENVQNGLFIMQSATEWMEQAHSRPAPSQLFRSESN